MDIKTFIVLHDHNDDPPLTFVLAKRDVQSKFGGGFESILEMPAFFWHYTSIAGIRISQRCSVDQ